MVYNISKYLCYIIFKFFFKLKVEGVENIPKEGNFILAANHVSHFDPPVVGSVCPRIIRTMAKEELFSVPFLSWYLKQIKSIRVKRTGNSVVGLREALKVLKKEPVLLFPQGTRSADYESFKGGVGFLVKKSGLPVIVAKVSGTDKAFPKGKRFPRFTGIFVKFSLVSQLNFEDDYAQIAAQIADAIKTL
ncbi:MAG: lysophospholipid acyltransferase family protein [Candidatus Omnitrophica bacterium]|nr:lysophospholipid acyltransferase family protein [Candidatus Omnitrophota bacterium]